MVSERALRGLEIPSLSSGQNKLHQNDPYHITNTEGYIKLSSADSILSDDLINAKFDAIDWKKFDKDLLYVYPRAGGEKSTLETAAKFINRYCLKNTINIASEELIIVPGVTTAADLLGQILFDSGDFVLVPAPYYYRFANDFGERGLVKIGVVPALSKCGTRTELKVENFKAAYEESEKFGNKVRAITLVNPQNPEGGYFSLAEIQPIIEWAVSKDLYVLLDEIYDLSIYDEDPKQPFKSAIELFQGDNKNKLIWMWGLSKNFSLPGLRVAVLYTPNIIVRTACTRFLMHHLPNTTTQFIMRQFLDDHNWISNVFLAENLRRLKSARDQVIGQLDRLRVPYLKPRAGFFILVDFSRFMDEQSYEGERRLHQLFLDYKVIISAGETMFAPKPGWFRIVFTSVDSDTLDTAMCRIAQALTTGKNSIENGQMNLVCNSTAKTINSIQCSMEKK